MTDVTVSQGGRVVIPAELRAELGIGIGDQVTWKRQDGQLVLTTRRAAMKRAQMRFARCTRPSADSVVDELIRERREESSRE